MNRFDITYFHGPFREFITKPEVIADIAASGITLVPLGSDTETNKTALRLLRRYGLRGEVHDPRISGLYHTENIAAVDKVVREIAEDYAEFENLVGWDITDEPNAAKFPILAAIVNAFRRYSPDRETVINLFPNYPSPEQLGNPDYISHLEEFVNVVRPHFISYDHYHFLGREKRNATIDSCSEVDERERLIRLSAETTVNRGGFFENIEDIRNVSLKYDLDAMLIVLLTEHGPYRNLTYGELLWEVNMSLAYGMKRVSYFTYWEPAHDDHWQWTNAMCDTVGNKMQHYYDVQSINKVIKPVGEYLFGRTSAGVYHIGDTPEKGTAAFVSCGKVQSIDGDCGVIGIFDDGSMYLVNRDFLAPRTFRINTDAALTVMKDSVFVDAKSNEITLAAGEGVLIKAE